MQISTLIARQLREAFSGKNWSYTWLSDVIEDISYEEAVYKIDGFNTIAGLFYHINYYIGGTIEYFNTGEMKIRDKWSFDHPELKSEADWKKLIKDSYSQMESYAKMTEQFSNEKLTEDFWENKTGDYFRNLSGVVEHTHYHMGQIVLLKKLVRREINN